MTTASSPANLTLSVRHVFRAPREQVFRAWTQPEQLKRWWGTPGFSTPLADIDLQEGGRYRIGMQPPEGDVRYITGAFREVRPPRRLVYTWAWEPHENRETLVTVEFRELTKRQTEVVLQHEWFGDDQAIQMHSEGWNGCFLRLGDLLEDAEYQTVSG